MKIYDPFTQWAEMESSVKTFQDNHRIDPYTPDEIKALATPPPKER